MSPPPSSSPPPLWFSHPTVRLCPQDDKVQTYMTKFKRTAGTPYTIITPSTPLAELKHFLDANIFAIVTDWERKFVLGVVTSADLEVRPSLLHVARHNSPGHRL